MIDKEYLSEIIADKYDETRLISEDDIVTEDIFKMLSEKQSRFLKCFVTYKDKDKHFFKVELPCEICGKLALKECSKTRLQEYCYGKKYRPQFICDKCEKEEEDRRNKQFAINEVETEKRKERALENYISNYLNTDKAWRDGTPQTIREEYIEHTYPVEDSDIREYILDMSYDDFLQTPYWKAIAGKIRRKAGYKCQICGANTTLSVHHRSYERHGLEHTYEGQRDLIAICQGCHEKFHFE